MIKEMKIGKSKLNIIIPFLLLVVVIAVVSLGTATNWNATVQRMEASLNEQVQAHVVTLHDELERQFAVLDGYGASFTLEELSSREGLIERLDRCMHNTEFSLICFAYPDGTLYRNDGVGTNVTERFYFKQAMQGESVIQVIEDSPIDENSRVGMAVPIVIEDEVEGVLLGLYDTKEFQAIFERTFSDISYLAYICDSEGKYIIGSKEAVTIMEKNAPGITDGGGFLDVLKESDFIVSSLDEIIAKMKAGEAGQAVYDYHGERRHTSYVPLEISDWYVVAVLEEDKIYKQAMGTAQTSYQLLAILAIAVLAIFSYLMFRERKMAISEKKKREEIKYLFEHDDLTGILNEKSFQDEVKKRLPDVALEEYCVVFLDIYKFKLFNDMFGYAKCDELLCALANDLDAMAYECNGVCGRISGDNFVIFMPHKEELLEKFYAKKYRNERIIPVEIYLYYGIYVIRDKSVPVARMIDCAQMAQKIIKGDYNNCLNYYDEKIKQKIVKEQEIINSMQKALDNKEFIVYLQPQYDYNNGSVCGAEALVRWKSPSKGLISPGDFIPVFESNGFIIKLDEYVWEQVCKLQRKWLDEGKDVFPISVNVSRADLLQGSVAEKLMNLIHKYNLTPDMVRVEITESAYMDNPQQLISEINKLEECGLMVEMDDFGSGYSSLNMLKDVPIQVLKTDLKFLSATGIESRKEHILDSVIRMAHGMDMFVIAEGVETKEQADYLQSLKCDQMQGYYFSRPIPVEDFEKLVYAE